MNKVWIMGIASLVVALTVGCGNQNNGNNGGGGNGGVNPDPIANPLPTATTVVGNPIGDLVPVTINQNGGSVTSQDGRLVLVVPPGALAGSANVSLQLIENDMPGGFGLGYRVTLVDATTQQDAVLAQPLSLEFTLSDAELTDNDIALENLTVAYQGTGGAWQVSPDAQTAPIPAIQSGIRPQGGGTKITAKLKKSGDYAVATMYKLHPASGSVRVNDKLLLTALKFASSSPDATTGYIPFNVTQVPVQSWNSSAGQLLDAGSNAQRIFKAPAAAPSPNPVRISATVSDAGKTVTLTSRVRVEDSKGWFNVYADVTHSESRSLPSGGSSSLRINGAMKAKFDAEIIYVRAPYSFGPNTNYDGGIAFTPKLDPGGSGTFSIKYTSVTYQDCVCTPKPGKIKTETNYEFTAAAPPITIQEAMTTGFVDVKASGAYQFGDTIFLQLKGAYTLTVHQTNDCDDKPSDTNESGEDTVWISGKINGQGTVKPQGPDRMTGADTSYLDVSLPGSLPSGASKPIKATVISDWYFDYAPDASKGNSLPLSFPFAPSSPQFKPVPPTLPKEDIIKPLC